jgi:ABC-type spermidine/putrescine transport system permease subunit II
MRRRRHDSGPGAVSGAMLVVLLVVLYAPLVYVVYAAFNANPSSSAWRGATFDWFAEAWRSATTRRAGVVSVELAAVTAVGATVTGTAVALAVRRRPWMTRIANSLAAARAASPEIIIATGLAVLLPLVGIDFGFVPVAIGHIAYLGAFVALLVGARAAGADVTHEEAALDLGASRLRVLWSIVLPDLRPAIIAAGLLAAAFSFDDVALSQALKGPNDTTLPVLIVSTINSPNQSPAIYAIGTMVMVVGAVTVGAAAIAARAVRRPALPIPGAGDSGR